MKCEATKRLHKEVFEQIRRWVYMYARNLDIARWQFHFEGGSAEAVLDALCVYQNDDGGFGHGLELDNMNPNSSPVQTLDFAWGILKEIGCDKTDHPLIQGIAQYLGHCPHISETGCLYPIPSNNSYPCRPWFHYPKAHWDPDDWNPEIMLNSHLVDFAFSHCGKNSMIYDKAEKIADYRMRNMRALLTKFLSCTKAGIGQAIETGDWLSLIRALERHSRISRDERQALCTELLNIIETFGTPETYHSISKRIVNDDRPTSDDLDRIIDELSHGKVWLKDGLLCDDPERKIDELHRLDQLWWPIIGAISSLRTLKEHDRLMP